MSDEKDTIIIRINSLRSRTRIICNISDTLEELKVKISKYLNIPPQEQRLFTDSHGTKELIGEGKRLGELNLCSGDILFLKSDFVEDENSVHSQIDTEKEKYLKQNPLKNVSDPQKKNDKEPRNLNSTETTFKSFDQFIKDRGYDVSDLPFNRRFLPIKLEKGKITKVPPPITLKHQPYRHVDHLEIMNINEMKSFVSYWRYDLDMCKQRAGFMYGYYIEDYHYPLGIRAVCEAIYEPPQEIGKDGMTEFVDYAEEKFMADEIAKRLGLELIGWIFTHLPRDELLTSEEVIKIAKLQLEHMTTKHFTGYPLSKFVTCTITPLLESEDQSVPNAFMVSDMGMSLIRDNVISDVQHYSSHIYVRSPKDGELMHQMLESGKETTKFDSEWLIVRVNESAPIKVRSIFRYNHFPCENRKVQQTPLHIKKYFTSTALKKSSKYVPPDSPHNYIRFSDFHLLLYVARLFDLDQSLSICDSIVNKTEIDPNLEEILCSLA